MEELNRRIAPYLFTWEEWTRSMECFLSSDEVAFIDQHLAKKPAPALPEFFVPGKKMEDHAALSNKLLRQYPKFQEWVIFNFLCSLIRMAETYGAERFFNEPVTQLALPEALKQNLCAFRVHHLRQLAYAYKAEDLKRDWVFANIAAFYRLEKQYRFPATASEQNMASARASEAPSLQYAFR